MLRLEGGIRSKRSIKLQEAGIHIGIHRLVINRSHHPLTIDTIEQELLHRLRSEEHFLYHHMIDSCVLYKIHLTLVVKYQRIVILSHKEMLHSPMTLVNGLHHLVVSVDRQRKVYTFQLKLSVGGKIKDKVIKQLISRLGHRSFLYQSLSRVHSLCVCH